MSANHPSDGWNVGSEVQTMNPAHHTNPSRDTSGVLRGLPIPVSAAFVAAVVQHFPVRAESRRGFVLVVGPWLVRVAEDDGEWTVQLLPQPSWIAESPDHRHSVSSETLSDGWDVLMCCECGTEW